MNLFRSFLQLLRYSKRTLIDYLNVLHFHVSRRRYRISKIDNSIGRQGVTVVITSCGRPDLLEETLESFLKFNDFPIYRYILVEDAGCRECEKLFVEKMSHFNHHVIFHNENHGQLASIDEAYGMVDTKFVFHIEDDWLFIRGGFIDYSIRCFSTFPNVCCVSIRPHKDWEVSLDKLKKNDDCYFISTPRNGIWDGIAINPGLYEMAKYRRIAPYFQYRKERQIALMYRFVGYTAVLSNEPQGYIVHAGDGRTTRKRFKVA